MIRINLLSQDLEPQKPLNPAIPIAFLGLVLVGGCYYHYTYILKPELVRLQTDEQKLKERLAAVQETLTKIEEIEKQKQSLQQRRQVIGQLEKERLRYPQFFENILSMLPSNLWLTSLTTSLQGDQVMMLDTDVVALDNYAIADLIANLENSGTFSNVELGSINASQNGTTETFSFHLKMMYRIPN